MTEITQADRDAVNNLFGKQGLLITGNAVPALAEAFARHRMEERAAIVAWFRRTADAIRKDADAGLWDDFTESEVREAIEDEITNANMIEAGDHLK